MANDQSGNDYSRPKLSYKSWPIDDDIVISGIGGRFPESENIDELAENLLNNVDMITRDDRRWPVGLNDNEASRSGKIKDLGLFDSTYFCTLPIIADNMDPGSRIILETTYEAIADAGIAPQQIRGSRTGVYCGINTVACAEAIPQDDFSDIRAKDAAFWVYGSSKALLANRISFLFDLIGPSTVLDTACSSSLVAMCNAVQDMRMGVCDMAIVATCNLCLAPYSSYIFSSLGLLANDGKCKVFDKNADGFVRSETIGAIFLQRRSLAKRVYATVLHAKTNTDGFKTIGLFAPFWLRQRNLMIETFQEAGIDPHQVKYFESHGTGTNVGDPQEAKAVSEAYCLNRKDKLLVGAVKSNLGHTEGASGICSVAKSIIIFEKRMIPANLHFKEAKPEIESLHKTIEPVVTNTPFDGEIIGVNSFGVGGVNAHVLLKVNSKDATDSLLMIAEPIPRLVNVCGRTEEGIDYIFDFIQQNPKKAHCDFLALLNDAMKTTLIRGSGNFPYRGYMLLKKKPDWTYTEPRYEFTRIVELTKKTEPVWLIFSGMGSQWTGMGKELMKLDVFRRSIETIAQVLKPYGIDLLRLIQSDDDSVWREQVVYAFVAITAMQIGLYDIVAQLELPIAGIIGHSFGEIACAYADGCISAEQAILTSYWRGKTVQDTELPKGIMAAIGLTWEEAKKYCTEGIYLACHNGHDSVTVSGLYGPMINFIERLQSENIFVRRVAGGEFAYHSVEMQKVAPKLLEKLKSVIRTPKRRSAKWVSTSVADEGLQEESSMFASGEYFVNNLQSPVLFEEGMRKIPKKAICIEIAPHSLFDSIFKRCYKDLSYISLMKKTEPDNLMYFLSALGKIYTYGLNPAIERLYPKVHWPVVRGTQSISSLLKWDHSKEYIVKLFPEHHNFATASNYTLNVTLLDSDWRFLRDHCIDGRIVFPATGYLMIAWRAMATRKGQPWHKVPVQFENIRICRPTLMNDNSVAKFSVQIIDRTGEFVVNEGASLVCTGKVSCPDTVENFLEYQNELDDNESEWTKKTDHVLNNKEIYKELRIRGYDYGPTFQGLTEASGDGTNGTVQWTGHWISYVDSALHLSLLSLPIRTLFIPVGIDFFRCDPCLLFDAINKTKENVTKESTDMNQQQLKSEFCYFKDIAEKSQIIEPQSSEEMSEAVKKDNTIPFEIMNFSFENTVENEKKVFFGVKFDFPTQTLFTKGVEVKGLIPINIPRMIDNQGLMLEQYRFVPFQEEARHQVDTEGNNLDNYIQACTKLLAQVMSKYKLEKKYNGLPMVDDTVDIEQYVGISEQPYRYVQTLKGILDGNDLTKYIETEQDLTRYLTEEIRVFQEDVLNDGQFALEQFTRPVFELIAENNQHNACLKVLEICPSEHLLSETICSMLKMNVIHKFEIDYTATRHEDLVLPSTKTITLKTIDWNLKDVNFLDAAFAEYDLIVCRQNKEWDHLWESKDNISKMANALKPGGFLLTMFRDSLTPFECALDQLLSGKLAAQLTASNDVNLAKVITANAHLHSILKHRQSLTGTEMALYRRNAFVIDEVAPFIHSVQIETPGGFDSWMEQLKTKVKQVADDENVNSRLWIISHSPISGILGFANCLRLESPYGSKVRIVFVAHSDSNNNTAGGTEVHSFGSDWDLSSPFVRDLVAKDLAFNVCLNGQWGSYRFLRLTEKQHIVQTTHAYLSQKQRGDLSSLQWYESEHKSFADLPPKLADSKELMCNVYYSALNFKDVVIASGKIVPGPESALFDCVIGLEFSGRRQDTGERVMGMVPFKGIATTVMTHKDFVWSVPDEWTLEEAASVPVIYITAYYALVMRGQLKQGESLLIHSGAGGVGQAAINIAQNLGCEIFVSVGTDEKRAFLKEKFGFDDKHIVNSRNTAFERHIKTVTKGRGLDLVLNSLTGDKLQASLRCLAPNGRFLEIGKYDMQMNTSLGMFAFLNNITFHGVGMDCFFREGLTSKKLYSFIDEIKGLIQKGIKDGVVKPINRIVFERHQVENAFRHMTTGKHIGKVIIRIREEEQPQMKSVMKPSPVVMQALCRTWFNPNKVYIIAGGLGGVGLELLYWMVLQGARKFVLTSRKGIKSTFQRVFLGRFRVIEDFCSEYKIEVSLSTENIAIQSQCQTLLEQAGKMGLIGGVFNLTLVLEDGLYENQNAEKFKKVCEPKFDGLVNLDLLTRQQKLDLDYFVAFSSFSAGRGNAGQTNYGYANSAMERVIEQRIKDGLNGIAVQYGPINDVGIVAEHMMTNDEGNEDAMKLLMGLEMQRIYSCLEVLNRILPLKTGIFSSYVKFANNVLNSGSDDEVIRQLCIHLNIDKRPEDECLGDIGLDSLAAVEIQQRLERDFNISLTLADVRKITVKELKNFRDGNRHNLKQYSDDIKKAKANLSRIRFVIPTSELTPLNLITEGKPFYCLPPLKGVFDLVSMLVQRCQRPVIGLNWTRKMNSFKSLKQVVHYYHDLLVRLDSGGDGTYDLMATSFGALIISLIAKSKRLSATLKVGKLIVVDLLPVNIDEMTDELQLANYKVNLMFNYIRLYIPERICEQSMKEILELNCEKERVEKTTELMRKCVGGNLQGGDMAEIISNSYDRASMMLEYHFEMRRKSKPALRRTLVDVMHRNKQIFLEYIKLVDKEDHIKGYERKLKSVFDVETFEEVFKDRYRMHIVRGNQDDLMQKLDGEIQELLDDIVKPETLKQ